MILCPWCGTHYTQFQSNCANCGGVIPARAFDQPVEGPLPPLPPAPRPVSDRIIWRLLMADGAAIGALALTLAGLMFLLVGIVLSLTLVALVVGMPFSLLGMVLLGGGAVWLSTRYNEKAAVVHVMRWGEAVHGEVTEITENTSLVINHRHPWEIVYQFRAAGNGFTGRITTLTRPGAHLQAGRPVTVLFSPGAPERNTLYPHP